MFRLSWCTHWAETSSNWQVQEVAQEEKKASRPLRLDGWAGDHCQSGVFCAGNWWMCCLYAGLLSLLPSLSLLLCEPVWPCLTTQKCSISRAESWLHFNLLSCFDFSVVRRESARTSSTLDCLLVVLTSRVILAWSSCFGNMSSWKGGNDLNTEMVQILATLM